MGKKLRGKTAFRHQIEGLAAALGLDKSRFRAVGAGGWADIYQKAAERFADKTGTWRNGLHWAGIKGYSPRAMKGGGGCRLLPPDWYRRLPAVVPDPMVYLLFDLGGDWYTGEAFVIFESGLPELVRLLDAWEGGFEYYVLSKKYRWIMGCNHHGAVSFAGEGLRLEDFDRPGDSRHNL